MTTLLDEMLEIANGGCTAELIQQYIQTECSRDKNEMDEANKVLMAAKTHGIIIQRDYPANKRGYYFEDIIVPTIGKLQYGSVLLALSFPLNNFSLEYTGSTIQRYGSDLSSCFPYSDNTIEGTKIISKVPANCVTSFTLPRREKVPVDKYDGLAVQEIKQLIQREVTKVLASTDTPTNSVFFRREFWYSYSNRSPCHTTKPVWLLMIKVLYPSVSIANGDVRNICRQILEQDLLPRDFGIKNVDTLLKVYYTLLHTDPPKSLAAISRDRLDSHRIDTAVQYVLSQGGTLDGGKVGARKNFTKKETNT
jgi:hypothetical protein